MKEYWLKHSGKYGSSKEPFVKIPEDAIILGYHVFETKEDWGDKLFGLIPVKTTIRRPGVLYLVPKEESDG